MALCLITSVVIIVLFPSAECKPRDQCVAKLPDKDVELLPGMINVMNNQGCCPSFQAICAPETCPEPKPCPLYYEKIDVDGHNCCPEFKCGERIRFQY